MTFFSTQKFFPYTAKDLFELVCDVKAYPQFIPGILETKTEPLSNESFQAYVRFKKALFQGEYWCQVDPIPFQSISIKGLKGPFTHMKSLWTFSPCPEKLGTDVAFSVDFSFQPFFLHHLGAAAFYRLTQSIMQAFEKRAKEICIKSYS